MSKKLSITLLILVAFFVLGFSITANAKPTEVQVVNTPDVNVANTPDVSVTNTPDVNVVNRANVIVANTPNVSVANTPDVNVANITPLNVVVTNEPLKMDFHQEYHSKQAGLGQDWIFFDNVPSGKRLEVEFISLSIVVKGDRPRCQVYVHDGNHNMEVLHYLHVIAEQEYTTTWKYIVTTPITYYVPSHLQHQLYCHWDTQTYNPTFQASISGYYVDE